MALQQILPLPLFSLDHCPKMQRAIPSANRTFLQELMLYKSVGSVYHPIQVLIVMDGLKDFSTETLEWVLKNIAARTYCSITVVGIMPWLNIPLSSKTWSEIWNMDLGDLKRERKNDLKYQKVQQLIDLCQKYGVVPEIKTEMGHPLRNLVVEQITSLHAQAVVFDRHHDRKNIEHYAEKVPCHIVVMNDNGEVDMIKGRSSADNTPMPSSTLAPSLRKFEQFKKNLKPRFR